MAYMRITVNEVRKLRVNTKIKVTHNGEKVTGVIRFAAHKKNLRTKKYSIVLSMPNTMIDHDFIFEQKRRIKQINVKQKFTIERFL